MLSDENPTRLRRGFLMPFMWNLIGKMFVFSNNKDKFIQKRHNLVQTPIHSLRTNFVDDERVVFHFFP